ncbi:MAG: type II toxin-antitoxin system HicA family toxin [Lachnospiraceae bacterium]|jgi:predicted RNA binding protein YcfA (HicA-like mRNA interferase family)|nr:type II toxin-antitoxin system HicA family toxin [Lachnospiraceae bacterium]
MSKWDKLINRVRSLSTDMRFTELRKILESYGYTINAPKSGSSHYTFRKPGKNPITIPKHEPIKRIYVEMVREVVEEENANEND